MLVEKRRQTNVVWSFTSKCLDSELLKKAQNDEVDAIRYIVDHGDSHKFEESAS